MLLLFFILVSVLGFCSHFYFPQKAHSDHDRLRRSLCIDHYLILFSMFALNWSSNWKMEKYIHLLKKASRFSNKDLRGCTESHLAFYLVVHVNVVLKHLIVFHWWKIQFPRLKQECPLIVARNKNSQWRKDKIIKSRAIYNFVDWRVL